MVIDKIAALRKTALFGELEEAELIALAERAVEPRLARGELLFVAGDEARGLYVIMEGAVRAFRESLDGREQVIHVERAGATIAEVPLFNDQPYPSTVAAEEDSIVTLELVLTNQQIAARIGAVREVVSRALTRLQQNGLIIVEGRRVNIPSQEALAAYAGE